MPNKTWPLGKGACHSGGLLQINCCREPPGTSLGRMHTQNNAAGVAANDESNTTSTRQCQTTLDAA